VDRIQLIWTRLPGFLLSTDLPVSSQETSALVNATSYCLPIMAVPDGVDLDSLDYPVKVPYNGSGDTGANPLTENVNIWYEVC
jgi:hypothetical protein